MHALNGHCDSYLLDPSLGLIDLNKAKFDMAELCMLRIAYIFDTAACSEVALLNKARQGQFAFQDYPVFHWLDHLHDLYSSNTETFSSQILQLIGRASALLKNYGKNTPNAVDLVSETENISAANSDVLRHIQEARLLQGTVQSLPTAFTPNQRTWADLEIGQHDEPLTKDVYLLARNTSAIENAFEEKTSDLGLLYCAYGRLPFRCYYLGCRRFHLGFPTRKLRDGHSKSHDRSFKCEQASCSGAILGFPSQRALDLHFSLCHEMDSKESYFPNIKCQSLWKSLEEAIDHNDCDALRQLVVEAQTNHNRPKGYLLRALKKGNDDAAEILLDHLADRAELAFSDKKNLDSLYYAAEHGFVQLFKQLLKRLLSLQSDSKSSLDTGILRSVSAAARRGHVEIVRAVLQYYSDRGHYPDHGYKVARNAAMKAGKEDVALLFCSSIPEVDRSSQANALEESIEYGLRSCVKLILTNYGIPNNPRWSDIAPFITSGIDRAVEMCMERGLNSPDVQLRSAVMKDDVVALRLALERGAKIDGKTGKGHTALSLAAQHGHLDSLRLLLEHGAVVDGSSGSYPPLSIAVRYGHEDIVKTLLDYDAKVEAPQAYGNSLYAAAEQGHERIVQMLLDAGANINCEILQGTQVCRTPLEVAIKNKHASVAKMLLEQGARSKSSRRGI